MKIIAVYESEISGGTDRLIAYLIRNWPDKYAEWQVLCHRRNSGIALLKEQLRGYASITLFSTVKKIEVILRHMRLKKNAGLVYRFIRIAALAFSSIGQYRFFKKFFVKNKPDTIYLHQGGYPGSIAEHIAAAAARRLNPRIRVITSIQSTPAPRHKKFISKIEDKVVNRNTDYFIFGSKYTMQEYIKHTDLRARAMCVINEGIEANNRRLRLHNRTDIVNIGIIGSYEERKGHTVLLDAVSLLKRSGVSGFRLLSYGQPQYGQFTDIVNYARDKGVYELIEWHGYEEDFDKLYGPLDIVVQASIYGESMPLVPIEAAAYYKPVVASKLQGLMEIVEDGITGYLFDIGDSCALASRIKELINAPEKRRSMGEAARKRYEKYFTAKRMSKEYCEVFKKGAGL